VVVWRSSYLKVLTDRDALLKDVFHQGKLIERLERDLEAARYDLRQALERLTVAASRPLPKFLDEDPFKEMRGPDDWLTPDADAPVDAATVEAAMAEPPKDNNP
jgi:hypothetical protein